MKKLALATVLWFVTGYFVGAVAAWVLGITMIVAPVVGVLAAAVIAVDPRHAIWATTPVMSSPKAERLEVTVLQA
jgi:hypothetical protein